MSRFEKISFYIVISGLIILLSGIVASPFSGVIAGHLVLSALGMAVIGSVIWFMEIFLQINKSA